jgi:hypothetical protein
VPIDIYKDAFMDLSHLGFHVKLCALLFEFICDYCFSANERLMNG